MTDPIHQIGLPQAVSTYFANRAANNAEEATSAFAADALVQDDGRTFRGRDEILGWISQTNTAFEFTTTFLNATSTRDGVLVTNRIEGNFPGGVVDLRYTFVLDDAGEEIRSLDISV